MPDWDREGEAEEQSVTVDVGVEEAQRVGLRVREGEAEDERDAEPQPLPVRDTLDVRDCVTVEQSVVDTEWDERAVRVALSGAVPLGVKVSTAEGERLWVGEVEGVLLTLALPEGLRVMEEQGEELALQEGEGEADDVNVPLALALWDTEKLGEEVRLGLAETLGLPERETVKEVLAQDDGDPVKLGEWEGEKEAVWHRDEVPLLLGLAEFVPAALVEVGHEEALLDADLQKLEVGLPVED